MESTKPTRQRRRYTAEEKKQFVALYRESGLTQVEFARQHEIKVCTLHQWLCRRKQPTKSPSSVFKELLLSPPINTSTWSTEILLSDELTIRFGASVSVTIMAELVNTLRRP